MELESELPQGFGTRVGIGVELPLLELELNCKNGIDPSSDTLAPCRPASRWVQPRMAHSGGLTPLRKTVTRLWLQLAGWQGPIASAFLLTAGSKACDIVLVWT